MPEHEITVAYNGEEWPVPYSGLTMSTRQMFMFACINHNLPVMNRVLGLYDAKGERVDDPDVYALLAGVKPGDRLELRKIEVSGG